MTVLQVDHVTFGYGADVLFDDVSFSLALGERLALVAPNGQGKSTLLKLIAGELQTDEGRVLVPKSVRVAYLHQSHEPDAHGTVMDVLLERFVEARAARAELAAAEEAVASGRPEDLERLAHAQEQHHAVGADDIEREGVTIAHRVGFRDGDLDRDVASLSGGERGRLQLASVLASRPDLLLLDEPTNHLDLETVAWLESHLRTIRAAIIVVSHDRAFLDAVCPKTAELGLFKFRLYHCPYGKYVVERAVDLERERTAVLAQRDEIAKTEDFIRRNIAGQKTNQAKSRRKMLEKIIRLENPEDVWADARKLGLRFAPARRTGDSVYETKGLSASRGGRQLFAGVDLLVRRLDRIAIVGPNGAGKSTMLKMFAGQRMDEDRGEIRVGSNCDVGYFDQHLESLELRRSCIEEIRSIRGDMVVDAARQYLSRFRFWGDDPFRAVGSLSGGERTRLALAKLLLVPRNVLLLDEPTNHLDIPACEILEEALVHFEGTLIVVSHDRYFLDRVATRVLELSKGETAIFNEGYRDYAGRRASSGSSARAAAPVDDRPAKPPPVERAKGAGRAAREVARRNSKDVERRKRRVEELEKLIADGDSTVRSLRAELAEAPGGNWERVAELAKKEQEWSRKVDQWTEECLRLMDE